MSSLSGIDCAAAMLGLHVLQEVIECRTRFLVCGRVTQSKRGRQIPLYGADRVTEWARVMHGRIPLRNLEVDLKRSTTRFTTVIISWHVSFLMRSISDP